MEEMNHELSKFDPELTEEELVFPDLYEPAIQIIVQANDKFKTPSEREKII